MTNFTTSALCYRLEAGPGGGNDVRRDTLVAW